MLQKPMGMRARSDELWMLVRQDEHGVRTLVKDNMSKATAERELKGFAEAAVRKPYKVEYFIFPYCAANRHEVLAQENVRV